MLRSLINSKRIFGWEGLLFKTLHRLKILPFWHVYDFYFMNLVNANPRFGLTDDSAALDGVAIKRWDEIDHTRLRLADGLFDLKDIEMHRKQGMTFYAALKDNHIIALNAYHEKTAHLGYLGIQSLMLPEKTAYLNCAVTGTKYRNLGVGSVLRHAMLRDLWAMGFEKIVLATDPGNRAAVSWQSKNGFEKLGRISYFKWKGKNYWLSSVESDAQACGLHLNRVPDDRVFTFDKEVPVCA